jgi:hypothetical protein
MMNLVTPQEVVQRRNAIVQAQAQARAQVQARAQARAQARGQARAHPHNAAVAAHKLAPANQIVTFVTLNQKK